MSSVDGSRLNESGVLLSREALRKEPKPDSKQSTNRSMPSSSQQKVNLAVEEPRAYIIQMVNRLHTERQSVLSLEEDVKDKDIEDLEDKTEKIVSGWKRLANDSQRLVLYIKNHFPSAEQQRMQVQLLHTQAAQKLVSAQARLLNIKQR